MFLTLCFDQSNPCAPAGDSDHKPGSVSEDGSSDTVLWLITAPYGLQSKVKYD